EPSPPTALSSHPARTTYRPHGPPRPRRTSDLHRTRAAHPTPAGLALALLGVHSLPPVLGAAASSPSRHHDGSLLLVAWLALALLMVASLTLLRLLRRLEGNWRPRS